MDILAFALRKWGDSDLPLITHEVEMTIEALTAAISQHYTEIGKPLHNLTQEKILEGYWNVRNKIVTCTLDTSEEPHKADFAYGQEVTIDNPLQIDTAVTIKISGRKSKIEDIYTDYEAAGIDFPEKASKWVIKVAEKAAGETPQKRPKTGEHSPSNQKNTSQLSEALRRKVSEISSKGSSSSAPR